MTEFIYSKILKKFKTGAFAEAIALSDNELRGNAFNEKLSKSLYEVKENLQKSPEDKATNKLSIDNISSLLSFHHIAIAGKFRENFGNKSPEGPISGIKVNSYGDIVVSDDFNHRIQIYDKDFQFKHTFGQKGNKPGEFYYPKGLDIDSKGNIYVADSWNHRIQIFSREGKFISTFGSYGNKPGLFHEPVSIAINSNKKLWVVDRGNHRIQLFDESGNSKGSIGHRGGTIKEKVAELTDMTPHDYSIPSFEFPSDIAVGRKNDIYVVDSHNHRILKFNSYGVYRLSFGRKGKGPGEFLYPHSIAIDHFDNIFVSDLNNNRIQLFSPAGKYHYSIFPNKNNDNSSSPTVLECGKDKSLFVGFAFNPLVLKFEYSQISQEERQSFIKEFRRCSADIYFEEGNISSEKENWSEAVLKYEEAISAIVEGKEEIIPELPFHYLRAIEKSQKENISSFLLKYYENELQALTKSVQSIYRDKKNIIDEMIGPALKYEKTILEENVSPGEDNRRLHELKSKKESFYRKAVNTLLEIKRIHNRQADLFLSLLNRALSKEQDSLAKELVQKSLTAFYRNTDMLLCFLNDHDIQSSKCYGEIQKQPERPFNLREFRLAYELTGTANDFMQLTFPILKNSIHLLSQIALKTSTSKSSAASELFVSFTDEKNLYKTGSVLFKLRYDFTAAVQFKEGLRMLLSYFELNPDKNMSSVIRNRPFDKDWISNKSNIDYAKDLIELLFWEETGITESDNGLKAGLFYLSQSDIKTLQPQASLDEKNHTESLGKLQEEFNQLLSQKKEYDSIILKHDEDLIATASVDQKKRLSKIIENKFIIALSIFGNKMVSEYLFSYSIINFKRCLCLLLNYELKKNEKSKGADEIYQTLNAYHDETLKKIGELKYARKDNWQNAISLHKSSDTHSREPSRINRAKEINKITKSHQIHLEMNFLYLLNSKYTSVSNTLQEIKTYLKTRNNLSEHPDDSSNKSKSVRSMRFGFFGSDKGQFFSPTFICTDAKGNIYAADDSNHKVNKFSPDGSFISSLGSYGNLPGFLNRPNGVLCNYNNDLLICDSLNHRIQKLDGEGNPLTSWGSMGSQNGCFNFPFSICQDDESNLYVSDLGNHRIQKISADGEFILSFGKEGNSNGEFNNPTGICFFNGMLFVGEISSDRIQVFDKEGRFIKSFNYSLESTSRLQGTACIASDKNGQLYISECWNKKIYAFPGDTGVVDSIKPINDLKIPFSNPYGITITGQYLYFCDHYNNCFYRTTTHL